MRPAAFVDRDGVINAVVPHPDSGRHESPLCARDVELLPGVPEALRELRALGFAVVVASNQPSAAKGTVSLEELRAVHQRVDALLAESDARPDAYRYCLHHPEGPTGPLVGPCRCRKPAPGLLLAAAFELGLDLASSWMLGDADSDVAAGAAAGCRTVLVEHPPTAHRRDGRGCPTLVAASLPEAVRRLAAP